MLTIREIKRRTENFLAEKGVPDPRLDADLLIAHSLGIKRLEIYLEMERPLMERQLEVLRPLVKRRSDREPLQYIVGRVRFADIALKVDSRTLIPRPETEELFERVCRLVGGAPGKLLDLGTGAGGLAIALAVKFSEATVHATDLSSEAISLAEENASTNLSEARIRFFKGSWYDSIPKGERYDLIVSNPPYLTEKEMTTAEPEVATYEPRSALVSGVDGLEAIRVILAGAPRHLNPGGMLALETGIGQRATLESLSESVGLIARFERDSEGRPRFLFCRRREANVSP